MSEQQADALMAQIAGEVSVSRAHFSNGWSLRKRELWGSGQWAVMAKLDHLLLTLLSPDEWDDKHREWAGLLPAPAPASAEQ